MKALLFSSLTCQPCKPWLATITAAGIKVDRIYDMCCRQDCDIAQKFSIRSTPTLIYTADDGKTVIKTFIGTVEPRKILRWLSSHREI